MISCFNTDNKLVKILGIPYTDGKNYKSFFIDWISTSDKSRTADLLIQTNIIENSIKKNTPTVIFDGTMSISNVEYEWLIKQKNIKLCEPSLLHRNNISYLPNWIKIKTIKDIGITYGERNINLGYIGRLKNRTKTFEKYYTNIDLNVHCMTIDDALYEKANFSGTGVEKSKFTFADVEYTILIGSDEEYKRGVLDKKIIQALENNCIPIIPEEHRFYQGLRWISSNDWQYILKKNYHFVHVGLLLDTYEKIDKYYPEMRIENCAETIKTLLKGI